MSDCAICVAGNTMPLSHSLVSHAASIQAYVLTLHIHVQAQVPGIGALEAWTVLEQLCTGCIFGVLEIPKETT